MSSSNHEIMNPCFSPSQPVVNPSFKEIHNSNKSSSSCCSNNQNRHHSWSQSKYLSFVGPYHYPCCATQQLKQKQQAGDYRLYVVNLEPFWEYIHTLLPKQEEATLHNNSTRRTIPSSSSLWIHPQNQNNKARIKVPITNTQDHLSFTQHFVQPLLYPTRFMMMPYRQDIANKIPSHDSTLNNNNNTQCTTTMKKKTD